MPQAGNLTPPSESNLRHAATAPNLRFISINRYANLDADSPVVSGSPPNQSSLPVKFFPLPSKYGQLSGMSNISLSTSPKKEMEFLHGDAKPSFTVGHDEAHEDFSAGFSRLQIPTTIIHTCDSTVVTPRGTPSGSPSLLRRVLTSDSDSSSKSSGGFFGWLTKPGPKNQEEPTFFHQKEDMPSVQALTSKARLIKPRPKLPVSMSDVNVFTPTEY
jgi:hypothetical protein